MSARRTIRKQSLPDAIADDLRERILSGELAEGETIRQEALAAEYDVSRMPVREALKRLDAEGLVQWTNNRGGMVTRHSLDEIGEIFDLRMLIEADLFRRAIPQMAPDDFARCEDLLTQMEASFDDDDVARWGVLNHRYHRALYAAARRSVTNDILDRVNLLCDRYVRMNLSVMKQRETAKREHRELLRLAREARTEEACDLLVMHIRRTRDQLLEMIAANRRAEGG